MLSLTLLILILSCAIVPLQSGKGPMEALMVMVPEAYRGQPALDDRQEVVDFYQYWEAQQEAWDGPALLVWSDGKKVSHTSTCFCKL
jgi:glutamate synthase (ferredoxin)